MHVEFPDIDEEKGVEEGVKQIKSFQLNFLFYVWLKEKKPDQYTIEWKKSRFIILMMYPYSM